MAARSSAGTQTAAAQTAAPDPLRLAPELSDLQRSLIRLLQVDGRRSYAQMARELGVTEKTVRRHVGELIGNDVIQITTVAHPSILGYGAMAMLGIRAGSGRIPSDLADAFAGVEGVDHVAVTTGRYDLIVELLARDLDDLRAILDSEVRTIEGVDSVEVLPSLMLYYQEPRWEESRRKAEGGVGHSSAALEPVDRAILAELSADGRASFQAIAERVPASEAQVRQRVNRMTGSGLVRVMAITNPRSLGFRALAWLAIEVAPGARADALARSISELPAIAYLIVSSGRFDILAEAICVDQADLMDLLDHRVRSLSGVARVEACLYLDLRYRRLPPSY